MKDRSEVWAMFMAAEIAATHTVPEDAAARFADNALAEYDKRFPQERACNALDERSCSFCKHVMKQAYQEPCKTCFPVDNHPSWEAK